MAVFRPIRAEEGKIKTLGYNEGYLYFAKDTGKIFLDVDGERKVMGGSGAALYYANDTEVKVNFLDKYLIDVSTLEDPEASPQADDLILNIPNGCFYRVLEATETELECDLLAVSGSGGGGSGGGGGGGGEETVSSVKLDLISPKTMPTTFIYGQDYFATFRATATDDYLVNISIQVTSQIYGETYYAKTVVSGQDFELNIGSYLPEGASRLVIQASADNATNTAEKRYTNRQAITLGLKKVSDLNPKIVYSENEPFLFKCMPVGLINKTLEIYVDDVLAVSKVVPSSISDALYTVNVPAQSHGAHKVSAIITAEVNGTVISTDPIEYEIAWKESDNISPIIWLPNLVPEKIVQYEDLNVQYVVYDPSKEKEIDVQFYRDGELVMNRTVNYSSSSILNWSITDYEVGTNNFAITSGTAKKTFTVLVEEDTERDMEILTGGLVLNLDSSGRSNEEYASSRNTWTSKGTPTTPTVKFKNFNWYNNGWILDENGRSCLRISNGASISIPISTLGGGIFASNKVDKALAFEFRFKLRNVQKYNTLIATELDPVTHMPITVVKSTEGAFCKYYGTMGFCLGTQEAFLKSSNNTVSGRYKEEEMISLTFVVDTNNETYPLLYIYINGILSGITKYGASDTFNANVTSLEFNSDYCDVDLYKVRIYKDNKLNSADVVHNYIADLKDSREYDINQIIVTANNVPTIDYNKMLTYNINHPDATIMPYMVIESADNILPFVKGGKKAVNIEFHNPALDYAYEHDLIDGKTYLRSAPSFKFESAKASLDVQGTSSQGYPRRNYKWKAKQKDAKWRYLNGPLKDQPLYEYDAEASAAKGKDVYIGSTYEEQSYKKFHLDSDIGESTFCFKADYMESSGTHNTGFASFVREMYTHHPLYDYGYKETDDIRTTVYGFPMLVFQKTGANTYDFVGRYNFNLDKGCDDSYGFTYDADSYVKDDKGKKLPFEKVAECWELTNNQGLRCSFTKVDFEETVDSYTMAQGVTSTNFADSEYYIKKVDAYNAKEYYELATEYNANDIYYTKTSGALSVLNDFEARYSYFDDDIEAAIDGKDDFEGKSQAQRNQYILDKMKNLKEVCEWLNSTDTTSASGESLPEPVTYNDVVYEKDTKDYRLAKFLAEFNNHFSAEYCQVYYIMTELLHLYDSRGKNMMLATWGPKTEGGSYIWYPIFYDIDTQLGINNSGVPTWDYSVEPSKNGLFSTSNSVLWTNYFEVFKTSILSKYVDLRKNYLTISELDSFYNAYPIPAFPKIDSWRDILSAEDPVALQKSIKSYAKIGKKPIMTYNVDQYYKYISPTLVGFINTSGNLVKDSGSFFYCLQGSRALSRYLYLRNRFNYVDSLWHGGAYATEAAKTEFWSRYDANYPAMTSDRYLVTTDESLVGTTKDISYIVNGVSVTSTFEYTDINGHPLDMQGDFLQVKSYLNQYMSLQLDDKQLEPVYCNSEPIDLKMPQDVTDSIQKVEGFTQQLLYIGGGEYISDLGDLSLKYLDELHIPTLRRLKSLILGNDMEGFYNNQLNGDNFDLADTALDAQGNINENAKSLLEKVVLTGLGGLNTSINVSGSEKLKEFRALKTPITDVVLADGVQIEILHLPNTVTTLKLTEPILLKNVLTSPSYIEDEDGNRVYDNGLYVEDLTNVTDISADNKTKVNTLDITGGNLGYDSYKLLNTLYKIKKQMQLKDTTDPGYDKKTNISLTNVNWSPYVLVEYGEPYDPSKTYYWDAGKFKLEPYSEYQESTWKGRTLNGKMYEYIADDANSNTITNLDMFSDFIDSYEIALDYFKNHDGDTSLNYFRNTQSTGVTLAEISGIIAVNNTVAIDEDILANRYLANFPKLKIFAKQVNPCYSATFVMSVDGVETEIWSKRISTSIADAHVEYPGEEYTPVRFNYDFVGWSLDLDGEVMTREEIEALTFSESKMSYKFYAVFVIHEYKATFYSYDSTTGIKKLETQLSVPAGTAIGDPNILPCSPQESTLELNMRYKFLGWVSDTLNCYPSDEGTAKKYILSLDKVISENRDRDFYACYIQEDATKNLTDFRYFNFYETTYTALDGQKYECIEMRQKGESGNLRGKITLPTVYNDLPVMILRNFTGNPELTHVFFYGPDNLRLLRNVSSNSAGSGTFADCGIKYFQFPSTLESIESGAFHNNPLDLNLSNFKDTNVKLIETWAFNGVSGTTGQLIIPGSVETIKNAAFSYWNETARLITLVQIGSSDRPSQLTVLGDTAFIQNPSNSFRNYEAYVTAGRESAMDELLNGPATTPADGDPAPNISVIPV